MSYKLPTVVLCLFLFACEDQICGPAEIASPGIHVSYTNAAGEEITLGYGEFNASPNNDCTPNVGDTTSITVDGRQVDERSFHLAFCLPRPQSISTSSILLSNADLFTELYVNGTSGNCTIRVDRKKPMNGTITMGGFCDNGTHAGGFSMVFDGDVGGIEKRTTE